MALKNDRYTYRVTWSETDSEFSSLSWLASTPEAALKGIRKVVVDVVVDLAANGESIPKPIAAKFYSGKFGVRVPPRIAPAVGTRSSRGGHQPEPTCQHKIGEVLSIPPCRNGLCYGFTQAVFIFDIHL